MSTKALLKLAKRFELVVKAESDNQNKELLDAALKANKGQGVQIYFNGQHFGWYKWDDKKNKHEQFSIKDFDNDDTIGELEKDVGKLTKVNLEDFLPTSAGRKQV